MLYRRIRDFREDKDLRQEDIAQYLHCTQRSYSRYECGESDIPTDVLIKLADFHNTTIDYLLERTDSPEPLPKPKRRR